MTAPGESKKNILRKETTATPETFREKRRIFLFRATLHKYKQEIILINNSEINAKSEDVVFNN
jgi:hypothetical protein